MRRSYFGVLMFVALIASALGVYALGIGGTNFLTIVALVVLPVFSLLVVVSVQVFPVDLEERAGFPARPPDTKAEDLEGSEQAFGDKPFRDVAPKFEPAEQSGVVEWVISAGLIIMCAVFITQAALAVLDRVLPDPVEIKHAQEGFALSAALGAESIAFTNMSEEPWSCEVLIGTTARVGATFKLAPGRTREIRYLDFRPSLLMIDAVMLRSAAHDQIEARCTDASGRFRSGLLR